MHPKHKRKCIGTGRDGPQNSLGDRGDLENVPIRIRVKFGFAETIQSLPQPDVFPLVGDEARQAISQFSIDSSCSCIGQGDQNT